MQAVTVKIFEMCLLQSLLYFNKKNETLWKEISQASFNCNHLCLIIWKK